MLHPDSDLLTAWLDGELPAADAALLDTHLATCPACAARAREQRALQAEADRLIAELDEPVPGTQPPAIIERDIRLSTNSHPAGRGSPVVLLPYTELIRQRRGVRRRIVGVAATLFVAAGAGWMALRQDASGGRTATEILSNVQTPAASTQSPPPASTQSSASPALADSSAPSDQSLLVAPSVDAPDSERTASIATQRSAKSETTAGPPSAAPPEPAFAEAQVSPVSPRRDERAAPTATAFNAGIAATEPQRVAELKPLNAREPLAVERDAQISTRIGLDEARRELGGNLHVIDGMQAELVGLVPGRLVPGADSSRPVVRVVYLDGQGQSFFLDQQRITADARDRRATPGAWLDGDVQLHLHGALSNDSLARLARRVK